MMLHLSIFKRNKNFALLYVGQLTSFFGTMITSVALPYQIYHLTQSTLMVGLLSLVQLFPVLVTALVGGVFADRYHRRRLLIVAELVLMLGCGVLAFNAAYYSSAVWPIFALSFLMSAFNGLHRPALESIVQQIVSKEDYAAVGSLATFKRSLGMIAGPALGGVLLATQGLVVTYLVDFVTFLVSLSALLAMSHIPAPVGEHLTSVFSSVKQGLKYAVSRQELMGSYSVDFIAMVFGMPMALFPAIAQSYGGAKVLGLFYAAPAVGMLLMSLMSGWTSRVAHHGRGIAYSAIIWGLAVIAFGMTSHVYLALAFLVLGGAADALSGIFRMTLWNQTIPQHLRGRLAGIEMISYLSGPRIGDARAGLVAAVFGVTTSILSGGMLCVVGVAACSYYLPKFWHYKAEIEPETAYDEAIDSVA